LALARSSELQGLIERLKRYKLDVAFLGSKQKNAKVISDTLRKEDARLETSECSD
jgi:hypothetical protein